MKKLTALFLCVLLILCMSACGSQNAPNRPPESIRNEETISTETTDSETGDTTDMASNPESADDTEEPEPTPNTDNNSDMNIDYDTGRPTVENKPVGTTKSEETNPPDTQPPVKNPSPSDTQKPAETNPPETQKPVEEPNPDPQPPVPVTPPVTQPPDTEPEPEPIPEPTQGKTLIVYFSWSSNTEKMAKTIQEQTGGDLLELIPVTAYPTDYTACTEVALEERDNNARPAIQNLPASIDEYDTILIGYPIWWHTAPMIIGTFLESYDLTGVSVYPFTQSASMNREQFENSMEFVRECADGATVHDGLFARYSDTSAIVTYLNNNNLTK